MDKNMLMQIGNCAICPNMCRFDCPVNNAVRREVVSPAGKMRLAYMLEQQMLLPSVSVTEHLYQCLGCRSCETWCPFPDLSVADLLAECRINYAHMGLAPEVVYEIKSQLDKENTLFKHDNMVGLEVSNQDPAEVLLFAGCAYRKYRPQAITAAVNLLQASGIKVTLLEDETCCGFPSGCLGLMDTTAHLAMQTAVKINASSTQQLLTLCPECYSAFNKRYPGAGITLNKPVRHMLSYILELMQSDRLPELKALKARMVWHDPCVMGRGQGMYDEPRRVLGMVPGLTIIEPRYSRNQAHCCGAGQLYNRLQPKAAHQIAQARINELEADTPDIIVTGCPFCEQQLASVSKLPVADWTEVVWAALQEGDGSDFFLRNRVEQALRMEPALAGKVIEVTVAAGEVTLTGEVDNWAQVVKAGQKAGSLPGVYSVVNKVLSPEGAGWDFLPPSVNAEHNLCAEADIVIIGGGVVGCAIARELSRYQLSIVVLEKASDVGTGASKANNGMLHPGIFVEPGTLKARLNVRGVQLYPQVAAELDFQLHWCGLLGVVTKPEEMFLLELIKKQAEINGVNDVKLLSREEVLAREPNITRHALGGFWAPTTGMVSPYKVTVAYAENAAQNGVGFYFDTPVTGIQVENGRVTGVLTPRGRFACQLVINAAGIYADHIAALVGEPEFTLHARRGELLLFDNKQRHLFNACLAEVTLNLDPHTKGGGIMMTVDGNIEMGPTAEEIPSREDVSTTRVGMLRVLDKFKHLVEGFEPSGLIAYFSGLRAATYTEDFHIRFSRRAKGLLNVAGIQSPGLAAAPAIAEYVLQLLREQGWELMPRSDFNSCRVEMTHFNRLSTDEKNQLIQKDNRYGQVVCRCETVTEGEIVEAIHRPIPATNLDAVKRRTRAGMGRCQGSFCTPRVASIIAREMGIPLHEVTKNGRGSWMFVAREGGQE